MRVRVSPTAPRKAPSAPRGAATSSCEATVYVSRDERSRSEGEFYATTADYTLLRGFFGAPLRGFLDNKIIDTIVSMHHVYLIENEKGGCT